MKKSIITVITTIMAILAITLNIRTIVYGEGFKPTTNPLICIGFPLITPNSEAFLKKNGHLHVKPIDLDVGVLLLGQHGYVCKVYPHNYKKGICVICNKIEK